ncbi:hypothetical protein WEU38_00295 [Cyanobacterium aponinum AL20118]|uniref:Filamentous hemagglutinin n=1 Tax=Cyanobacterium aponinum AL20115 TaxID=3090662 RepID=A0AAF1C5P6_9CHRO|nr:hypothetical protein [Cyanobacterium aponinum]PHV63917.1 hypothetical protein CSQ80_02510 [Cyanobacterium aponinum IPPAS B-1201]WPF88750.1 hypothetical protein SAY89_00300 [Cyanobacterium aponinum AL20115]
MKNIHRVLLVSGMAIGSSTLFGASALAGGGMAGSAAFNLISDGQATPAQVVSGVATAAAVGQNGASAWSFQTGTNNSAGAIGSAGVITVDTFSASSVTSVSDTVPASYTDNTNTLTNNADIQLGTTSGDAIINSP